MNAEQLIQLRADLQEMNVIHAADVATKLYELGWRNPKHGRDDELITVNVFNRYSSEDPRLF